MKRNDAKVMEEVEWSGKGPIPAIGTKVDVGVNHLGPGEVIKHFIHAGFLGVEVKLDKAGPDGLFVFVFGIELEMKSRNSTIDAGKEA